MKYKLNIPITWKVSVLAIVTMISFSACKQTNSPKPATQYTTLLLHLHTNIDTNEAAANKAYRNADGRLISLSYAQLYLSNIRAIKSDGSLVYIKDTVVFKNIDEEEFTAGQIPSGNYRSVMFDVGVDSPANHISPFSHYASSPLAPKTPSMWFGNTGEGYIFLNIAGLLDTSSSKYGTVNYPFSYQIGSDALLKTVAMPDHAFTALPNTPHVVHITIDYGKLFNGIDIIKQNKNSTFDNPVLAKSIAGNIPAMFRYEQ